MNSDMLKEVCDRMCVAMFEPPLNPVEYNFRNQLIDNLVALKRASTIVDLVRTAFSVNLLWAPPPPIEEFMQIENSPLTEVRYRVFRLIGNFFFSRK